MAGSDTGDSKPIELRPQPKATRLNRMVVALVGIAAILVLWIATWALGRRPARTASEPPRPMSRPLDVDRLREARPELPASRDRPLLPAPPPPSIVLPTSSRPPTPTTGHVDPAAEEARRALRASPMVAAFASGGYDKLRHPASRPTAVLQATTPNAPPADESRLVPGLEETKVRFLEEARAKERRTPLAVLRRPPTSPFTLLEGTYLPAILTAGINSDLPGAATALIRQNVYDSRAGRHLLVPAGSRVLGEYDHRIAFGEKRLLVAWHRVILPDGSSFDLRGMPGVDLAGEAGVRDRVNNHFVRTFGSALLLSAFSAGAQLSQPQESASSGQAPSARQIVTAALGQELNRAASLLLRRNLQVQPTLELRPGYEFWIQLTADLVLDRESRMESR